MLKKVKENVKKFMAIPVVLAFYNNAQKAVLTIFSVNRLLSTLYYALSPITFSREQYAVLKGRAEYYKKLNKAKLTSVELRRNVHRLEKGLIMKPARDVFAKDYIGETIDFYKTAVEAYRANESLVDESEMRWAYEVMTKYFKHCKTGKSEIVDSARNVFENLGFELKKDKVPSSPYEFSKLDKKVIAHDEFSHLVMNRRSVRWFTDKKIDRKDIEESVDLAVQSPSACNRSPYEYYYFDDPKLVKEVADIPFGAGGYSHQIPGVVVVVGDLANYFSPRDRHAIYIDGSLSAMTFMYSLQTKGLGSCVINWPDFEPLEVKMQKKLGLKSSQRVIMLIAVGHPDEQGGVPSSRKKSTSTILRYNK